MVVTFTVIVVILVSFRVAATVLIEILVTIPTDAFCSFFSVTADDDDEIENDDDNGLFSFLGKTSLQRVNIYLKRKFKTKVFLIVVD
jgi:hypothetical protein